MASFEDALRQTKEGLLIGIEVQAGSARNTFPSGYNSWRKAIGIAVTAPPIEGRANRSIIALVAEVMGVPGSGISIVSGHQSSRKVIRITGMDLPHGVMILKPFFDE
jgi:hypothetical protein